MVVEYIRYRVPDERSEAFVRAYRLGQASLRLAPECLAWELTRCEEDPTHWTMRIEWTSTADHLQGFRKGPWFPAFLEQVRPFVDAIEEMRHYTLTDVRSTETVFEAAGGTPAFEALAAELHRRMVADDLLGSWFAHAAPSHVAHLSAWLAEVFGGPAGYTAEHGDIGPMLARHAGLDIPETHRARFEAICHAAVAERWPERPDVVQTVSAYLAWGTHIAVENSRPDHVGNAKAEVPSWGWSDG